MGEDIGDEKKWKDAIISILAPSSKKKDSSLKVKKIRKQVLLSLQLDEDDKKSKKRFKKTMKAMEEDGEVTIDADGHVTLKSVTSDNKRKRSKAKEEGSAKKSKKDADSSKSDEAREKDTENHGARDVSETDTVDRNKPCKGNPQGVTRLFLGNLPFAVEEDSLESFLGGSGTVTHIKWLTDKETGRFYGSAIVEMRDSECAAHAISLSNSQLMGRSIKINPCPARPGEVWPPEKKVVSGGSTQTKTTGGQAGGKGIRAMSTKPDNCVKLFIGNLSYDIDDDGIKKFFAAVDAEVKAVRWLHHKESGDFKGWYVKLIALGYGLLPFSDSDFICVVAFHDPVVLLSFGIQKHAKRVRLLMESLYWAGQYGLIGRTDTAGDFFGIRGNALLWNI